MWAFAYYSKKNNRVILSRDILEKNLYIIQSTPKIIFASNLKYIETISKKFSFNLKKVENFLAFGFKEFGNDDQTIFRNINFYYLDTH